MAISLIFYKYLFFIIYMVILFKKGLKIMKPTINDLYNITLEINNCFNYLFKNILKVIDQDFPKLLKPNLKKSKAPTFSSLYNFKNA